MFSRRNSALFITAYLVISLTGCTEFIRGKKSEPEVIEMSDSRFMCLQQVPTTAKKFSVGEAQEPEIRAFFDCISDALLYFKKKTFGASPDSYTVEEMRKFFGKYFLKQNNVSPEFAAELMKIKAVLLGGSTSYITKEEINRLVTMLQVVRDEAVNLAPHMKILLAQSEVGDINWENVSAATGQLRQSLQKLLVKTQIAKSEYGIEDIKKFMAGFANFVNGEEHFAPYDRYSSWLPLVEAVKNVLMGRSAHFADISEWNQSINTIVNLYDLVLKYRYSLIDLKLDNMQKEKKVVQFISQSLDLLQNTHQMRTQSRIPIEDLDVLIEEMMNKFSWGISEKALKKGYRNMIIRFLDEDRRGSTSALLNFEKKHLFVLRREFNIWRLKQIFVDSLPLSESSEGITGEQMLTAYGKFDKSSVIEKGISKDPFEQQALENAWRDLGTVLQNKNSVVFNEQTRIVISKGHQPLKQTWASLTSANLINTLSRLLMMGYGENTKGPLSLARIQQSGLISWYDDFQELGLDLKVFDPRAANSGSRSFLEANFFTFNGNGDQWMDQLETYQFVSYLFSAGLGTSESLRQSLMTAHCAVRERDVFGFPYFVETCFKTQLRASFAKTFNNLPGAVQFVQSLSYEQWDEFYRLLSLAAEVTEQKKGFVETANLRSMVMILHYIESLVVLYDADHSQGLSYSEVKSAVPRFSSFLRTLQPQSPDLLLSEGFAYLVFRGTMPDVNKLVGFQIDKARGLKDATRMDLLRLFGVLKDQISNEKK